MADLTVINQSSFTMNTLTNKYKEFTGPSYQIIVEGTNLNTSHLIISSLVLENSVEKADSFVFTVANAFDPVRKDFTLLKEHLAIGKTVEIKIGYIDVLETVFKGFITSVRYELTAEEHTNVVISGMDYSFKLMKGIKSQVFKKVKDSDVASKLIAAAGGLKSVVSSTNVMHEVIQQVGLTDYQFLTMLADRNGYEFFVSGQQAYFRLPPDDSSPVVTLTWGQTLLSLYLDSDVSDQTGTVLVRSWDAQKKETLVGSADRINGIGSGKDGKALLSKIMGTVTDNYFSEARTQQQLELEAKAIKNKSAMKLVNGEASCIGIPELRAGRYLQLAGLGHLNKLYYITATRHSIDSSGYITNLTLGGNMA